MNQASFNTMEQSNDFLLKYHWQKVGNNNAGTRDGGVSVSMRV
jgi:hypothetical protein